MTIEFGNRLQELRKENHLSQEELADKLGMSRQAVSKWECGEASPDTDNLIELSKIYNISLDELVGNKPKEKKVIYEKHGIHVTAEGDGATIRINDHDDDDDVELHYDKHLEERKKHPIYTRVNVILSSVITAGVVIAYVLLGTYLGLWAQAWPLFFLVAVIPSLIDACFYRNMFKFAYPILVAFVYFIVCMWQPGGLWHPLWVIFLSIPIYYAIAGLVHKGKKE